MLNVGWFTAAAGIWRRDDDLDRQVRFPVPAYLIETADERILVDTGLHPGAVADPPRHYGRSDALAAFGLEQDASLGEQVDLTTITRVVMTHMHFDHAGGLALLPPSVPVVAQRREWEAGRLVLGADVTHYASGLDDHRFPMFADDFAAQAASAERLRALRDAGAAVRPGHDPAVLAPGPLPL